MRDIIKLDEIWIYPVKSLGGIRLPEARILPKGLAYDRRWMLVDEYSRFLTQRELPQLCRFRMELTGEEDFRVRHEGGEMLIPVHAAGEILRSQVWEDEVEVREVDTALSAWFSDQLGMRCRLVAFPEDNPRPVDPDYGKAGDVVSLADGYPLLLIGQASLDDLNSKLAAPVGMNRFRPNLVVSGASAFAEDGWKRITIGALTFDVVKPCARCVVTTIDPLTGQAGQEPLRTLATFRRKGNKVLFGQNLIPRSEGWISEGDALTVIT